MQVNGKLKAAIIGYGISGKLSHAYGLQANPEFEIAAVCDLDEERRQNAARELGCPTFPDHRQLLKEIPELDLACVVTRSDTHCEIAADLLHAGIHTLITKPWVLEDSEAETLIAAKKRSGARLFPWVPVYWSEEFRKTKRIIQSGAIGTVFMIRRQLCDFKRRHDWQTESKYGGGYLLNWGAHIVQPLVALAEKPPLRISGHLQKVINPGDADDAFLSIIEFEGGCLGIAEFTQACEGLPSLMVQGDRGMIRSDGRRLVCLEKEPDQTGPPKESRYLLSGKPYGDEADIYRDVARTLIEGIPYEVSLEDAVLNTRILDAIRASHSARGPVDFLTCPLS